MNVKRELIAAIVRALADNTNLVRKPDSFSQFIDTFMGEETYDRRIAANVEEEAARALDAAKRFHTRHQFKKIIKHI